MGEIHLPRPRSVKFDAGTPLALSSVRSPYFTLSETNMNTQISTKLAAVLVALMMNGLILGGVAYLFSDPSAQNSNASSIAAQAAAETSHHLV
jgi:hypothetical protein